MQESEVVKQYDPVRVWRDATEREKLTTMRPGSGQRMRGDCKEWDDETATGNTQTPLAGHWMSRLAASQIRDALDLLQRGANGKFDPTSRPAPGATSWRLAEVQDYWDTVYWVWMERDDDATREFSLDWCCMVLQQFADMTLDADYVRNQFQRAGLRPRRPRRKQVGARTITGLENRRAPGATTSEKTKRRGENR